MSPNRLTLIFDRRVRKSYWIRQQGSEPLPDLINPPGPEETKDSKGTPAPASQAGRNPEGKPRPS